jgi:hypothetical protein
MKELKSAILDVQEGEALKTHNYIKDKFLRECFARELNEYRTSPLNRTADADARHYFRFGMDSGIWAVQKALLRQERSSDGKKSNVRPWRQVKL